MLAQSSAPGAVVDGMSLENIRTPELDSQLGLDQEDIPEQLPHYDDSSLIQLSN